MRELLAAVVISVVLGGSFVALTAYQGDPTAIQILKDLHLR